ncbi:MAG: cytochrome P450, partial [Actinomycetota bacterium]|nr:cytochrome P450 [Actinomycetota bacterium]
MKKSPRASSAGPENKDGIVASSTSEDSAGRDMAHEETPPPEPVELDISDPHFMAEAYDTYADLRAKGPVSRVHFAGGEEASDDGAEQPGEFFGRDTFFVTHYDEVISTLLDERFSVDPRSTMSPEQLEQQQSQTPEEFRVLSRSLLSIDPPDHKRLRKLVQPSFTGRGMQALRGSIQQIADDLLDAAERDA